QSSPSGETFIASGATSPALVGEFAHSTVGSHQHRIAREQQLCVQVRAATKYNPYHPPITSSSLPVILVYKRLRSNRTQLRRELFRLFVACLPDLRSVDER